MKVFLYKWRRNTWFAWASIWLFFSVSKCQLFFWLFCCWSNMIRNRGLNSCNLFSLLGDLVKTLTLQHLEDFPCIRIFALVFSFCDFWKQSKCTKIYILVSPLSCWMSLCLSKILACSAVNIINPCNNLSHYRTSKPFLLSLFD